MLDLWLRNQPAAHKKMGLFLNRYPSGKKYKSLHDNDLWCACSLADRLRYWRVSQPIQKKGKRRKI